MTITPGAKKVLIIVGVVLVIGAVMGSALVVGRSILSNAASTTPPVEKPRVPPPVPPRSATNSATTPKAAPKATVSAEPKTKPTTAPVDRNGWTLTGAGDVDVYPAFSTDLKTLNVDFKSTSFFMVTAIDYSLSYGADNAITRLVKGSLNPATGTRASIVLGTCSGGACVYDNNPHDFTLKVMVKSNNGLSVYLETLTRAGAAATPSGQVVP